MNAVTRVAGAPMIPDSAPFTAPQRAWLNGFLAGLYANAAPASALAPPAPAEDFPWHDPAIELDERLTLAEGRAPARRLMAAMAQLDCGQCGYLCKTYAEALAEGRETSAGLCVPGGKATQRALKALMAEAPKPVAAPAATPAAAPRAMQARFVSATRLTGEASAKDVRHVVIDLDGTGLVYEPGDSLGITARHDPALVAATITALGASGEESVPTPAGPQPLREAFSAVLDIARPLDRTLDLLAGAARDPAEAAALRRLSDGDDGAEPADADLLDLLEAFPSARPSLVDLCASLPALKPRLYSIASSPLADPGRVHLCVGVVAATRRGRARDGIASCHLAYRSEPGALISASVTTSHFRLPTDSAVPIIMIGPGTGIAPFRAFLQHRAATRAKGRAWLFFGDQRSASDFLFGDELVAWQRDGSLSRLSLAWSRDSASKTYVQHRMAEEAADLWRWLQDGAHIYVCGDASRMAKDVDGALRQVAISEGGMDADAARNWIVGLARQNRYQRDVY
ncbi:NAD(P)H-dependent nitrite reductase flavoprotein subunit [Humitalea rosea]|uniref:assimilatory sulfite reductase (NADPH) n=1 Tax=Humitalea rosea TaxID=990373 RepID=A0A2W7IBU9_9PROT|nr:sulfite reductase subunit alpha [Humitalea rosea]PZW43032.1 NAD(P)H-dependent nitrite reductase flavoprotein subunit [Humitalea rosea]